MRRALLLLLIAVAGCGGGYAPPETGGASREPPGSVDDYEQRIARMQGELAGTLGMPSPAAEENYDLEQAAPAPAEESMEGLVTDCSGAADLRDRICELAERICAIAARDQTDGDLQAKCESARIACARAREDVAASCD